MVIKLELVTGDIEKLGELDYVIMGQKNPLMQKVCTETGGEFQAMPSESFLYPSPWKLLSAPYYIWKYVACVNVRRKRYPESQYSRISEALAYAVKQTDARTIAMLPVSWREPDYVAVGMIYALWCVGFAATGVFKQEYRRCHLQERQFLIVSADGVEPFERVLENDCRLLWQYIRKVNWVYNQTAKGIFPRQTITDLRRKNITFAITKRVL